jgi:hypothetical protein
MTSASELNSAQTADYLRASDSGGARSKGLACRAIDTNARAEVRAMATHIDELTDVGDSAHARSFYSLETTLGGIRAVCELVKDDIVNEMDCNDIMKLVSTHTTKTHLHAASTVEHESSTTHMLTLISLLFRFVCFVCFSSTSSVWLVTVVWVTR